MIEKTRILIVDDEPAIRDTICDILNEKNYLPLNIATGREALEKIAQENIAVALIDIRLEDMSGLDVMRKIKEISPLTECILITGHASRETAIEAVNLGAYSYILKPYNVDQLLLTIFRAVEKQKMEQELRKNKELISATGKIAKIGGWEIDAKTLEVIWTKGISRIFEVTYDYQPSLKDTINHFHTDDRPKLETAIQKALEHGEPYDLKIRFMTARGRKLHVHTVCKPVIIDGKIVKVTGIMQDITEHRQAMDQIKASLKEKKVLLSEVHHRVKNNLQVIVSLLRLQSDKTKDTKYADLIKESENRILSMSLVHEQLYQSANFSNIDSSEYITTLVNDLFRSNGVDTNLIKLNIECADTKFDIDNAIPCGLIINELVTNCLKYAFPDKRKGEIGISFSSTSEDEFELIVSDNGVGFPENLDIRDTESMGLHLVRVLAEETLEGKMMLEKTNGTRFDFRLKKIKYRSRI